MFASDFHNDVSLLRQILNFFVKEKEKHDCDYLVILGDLIDPFERKAEMILRFIDELLNQAMDNIFFVHGNHESYFLSPLWLNKPHLNRYLMHTVDNLEIRYGSFKFYCAHGGVPVGQFCKGIFKTCEGNGVISNHCMFNRNNFLNLSLLRLERLDQDSKTKMSSFYDTSAFLTNWVETNFLDYNAVDYCLTGHVHQNQALLTENDIIIHGTVCTTYQVRLGSHTPSVLIFPHDKKAYFMNIENYKSTLDYSTIIFE